MCSGAPGFCRAAVLDFGARAPAQGRGPGLGWLRPLRGIACLTLPLLQLVTPAAATSSCSTGEYQTAALVAGCTVAAGSIDFDLRADQPTVVASFPAGTSGISFNVSADVEIDVQLVDDQNGTGGCLVGANCTFSSACADPTDFCIESGGTRFYFSGDHTGAAGTEAVGISGELGRLFSVLVRARADGQGRADYSHGSIYPCPWALPGCESCNSYAGCSSLEQPECDGTSVVRCDPLVTQTTGTCPTGLYLRSKQPIMGCGESSSTVRVDLGGGRKVVETIPAGLRGFEARLHLDSGSQGNLELINTSGGCEAGASPDCARQNECPQGQKCFHIAGVFVSRNFNNTLMAEVIKVTMEIPSTPVLAVAVNGLVGTATLQLSRGALDPCPAIPPGCALCDDIGWDLTGCQTWETAVCDGTEHITCLPSTTTTTTFSTASSRTTTTYTTGPNATVGVVDTTTSAVDLLLIGNSTTTTGTSTSTVTTAEANATAGGVGGGAAATTTLPTIGGAGVPTTTTTTTTTTTAVVAPPVPPAQLDPGQSLDSTASGGTVLVIVIALFLLVILIVGCCICLFFCFRSKQEKSKRSKAKNRVVIVPYDESPAKAADGENVLVASSDEEAAPPPPPRVVEDAPEILADGPGHNQKGLLPIQPLSPNARSPPPILETQPHPDPPSPLKLLTKLVSPKSGSSNLEAHSHSSSTSDSNVKASSSDHDTASAHVQPKMPPPMPSFEKKRLVVPGDLTELQSEAEGPRTPTSMQCKLTPTKQMPPPLPTKSVPANQDEEVAEVKEVKALGPVPTAPTVVPFASPSPSMSHCQPAPEAQPQPQQGETSSASAASGSPTHPARPAPRSYETPVLLVPSKARPEPLEGPGTGCSKAEASTCTPSHPPRRSKSAEETDLSQPPSTACNSKASTSRLSASSNHSMLSPTESWLPPIPSLFNVNSNPGDAPTAGRDDAPRPELPDSRSKMTPADSAVAGPSRLKAQPPHPPLPGRAEGSAASRPLAGSVDLASASPPPPPLHEPGVPGFMPPPFQPTNCNLYESAGLPLLC